MSRLRTLTEIRFTEHFSRRILQRDVLPTAIEGLSDGNLVILYGDTVEQFRTLFWVLDVL